MTEQQTGNFNVKESRQGLFSLLNHVLATAKDKFDKQKAANGERQRWARLIVAGVEAYGRLLVNEQLQSMEKRISALEGVKSIESQTQTSQS